MKNSIIKYILPAIFFGALYGIIVCILLGLLIPLLASCQAFTEGGECPRDYRVRFVADMNLQMADVFQQEVSSVTLFAFDESGTLVWQRTEGKEVLEAAAGNYSMALT